MNVKMSQPRQSVQVRLDDGRVYESAIGTPLWDFVRQAELDAKIPLAERAIAATVNNRLRELNTPVEQDTTAHLLKLHHADGVRIYRRSLSFLLVAAAHKIFPKAQVFIDHALPQRAYYCHVENHPNFNADELVQLRQAMQEMVAADLPIQRRQMDLATASDYFESRGDTEKVRLLRFRSRNYLRIYELGDFADYFFGYMVPSTGYLQWFDLKAAPHGFLLLYPDEHKPNQVDTAEVVELNKLDSTFHEAGEWLKLLEVRDIGQLNTAIQEGRLRELILIAEALHERRIAEIAQQAAQRNREAGARLILIAGPSSSGKTTFSKRLAIQLMTRGLKPFTLELDNYFVDRHLTPRDEKGEYDFESLQAINLALLNQQLQELIRGETVQLPRFDFHTGQSVAGAKVQLSPEHVIIMEGIHGLNPALTPAIDHQMSYRIYISPLTQLNIDRYNRVSTTDVRLLRRIVRDAVTRGWNATDTLERWESVGRGERLNIYPYQEEADAIFNSALVYELAMMRSVAEPHLLRVSLDHPKWAEANRLLSFLSWVKACPDVGIPDNSILREFIGGSNLHDFQASF